MENSYAKICVKLCTEWGKSGFTVVNMANTEFIILLLLFTSYCIIFYVNNCKPTFTSTCKCWLLLLLLLVFGIIIATVLYFEILLTKKEMVPMWRVIEKRHAN